jgi:hypothetical protein
MPLPVHSPAKLDKTPIRADLQAFSLWGYITHKNRRLHSTFLYSSPTETEFTAVLRIHDILGCIRIRIWIRGSMHPDSDPDPAIFVIDIPNCFESFFAYYFLKEHVHHFQR